MKNVTPYIHSQTSVSLLSSFLPKKFKQFLFEHSYYIEYANKRFFCFVFDPIMRIEQKRKRKRKKKNKRKATLKIKSLAFQSDRNRNWE